MENYENTNNEISLIDIWNRIWKNMFLVIIITFTILISGTITLFIYNNKNTSIRNEFNYSFLNMEDGKYPDGLIYDYNELISEELLEEVIENNPKFSGIDLNMLGISINRIEEFRQSGNEVIASREYLRLEINNKQFSSNKEAIQFIKSIHNTFLNRVKVKNESSKIVNLHGETTEGYLSKANDELTYEEIFSLISNQNLLISNDMNSFINSYGNVVLGNKAINRIKADYDLWYGNNVNLEGLRLAVVENNFMRNVDETTRLANFRLNQVNREIDLNEQVISQLIDLINNITLPNEVNELNVFYKEIEVRTIDNVNLNDEKVDLEGIIANVSENIDPDFDAYVLSLVNNQREVTDQYNDFKVDYLNSISVYQRHNGNDEFQVIKPLSMIVVVLALGVIGGIIGVSAALIKESSANKGKQLDA